ncbi:single-stranded DNA-binding protein, mitochondrial isoform X2 [Centruroides vittatus]|uniref:single-stranded DNA-binding protein, mitochondrial isoform X2 n=1 Tax=Centruroides vittatus TaxID=120091 RepID=UPI00350F5BCE
MNFTRLFYSSSIKFPILKHVKSFSDQGSHSVEKSINQVTLLGRVGMDPQMRGSESNKVLIFTLATNSNYKYSSGETRQKTEWHRISVFREHLRSNLNQYLKKGSRVFVQGRIMYGEIKDSNGISHVTTTIVADDVVFLGDSRSKQIEQDED